MIIDKNSKKLKDIINRGDYNEGDYIHIVSEIISNVKHNGDAALLEYTRKFDYKEASIESIAISKESVYEALGRVSEPLRKALARAAARIANFHEKQLDKSWQYTQSGATLGQKLTALDSVGVYVPGGKAAYPSSVLMNVIPAKVAGVKEIVMVTPATHGVVQDIVLGAAAIAGVDKIFTVGGAQAVAALAYGTNTVPKVDKIVGPGNIYVALAKKLVFGAVDIDMIAGPSEILIIADETANPAWVAADMLSQAEHDEMASAVAVVTSQKLAESIEKELNAQLKLLPKKDIAEKSLRLHGAIIVVDDLDEAVDISNNIAPEHLELAVASPDSLLERIKHAGAIFMGHYTPEPVGDYYAGPNHVLPTGGSARFFSPLGVYDFMKRSSIIKYDRNQLLTDGADIIALAESEGLAAHANAVRLRMKK